MEWEHYEVAQINSAGYRVTKLQAINSQEEATRLAKELTQALDCPHEVHKVTRQRVATAEEVANA